MHLVKEQRAAIEKGVMDMRLFCSTVNTPLMTSISLHSQSPSLNPWSAVYQAYQRVLIDYVVTIDNLESE